MTLYFDNGCTIREIASVSSEKEAYKIMNKFCEERGFKIYYVRQWTREVCMHRKFGAQKCL